MVIFGGFLDLVIPYSLCPHESSSGPFIPGFDRKFRYTLYYCFKMTPYYPNYAIDGNIPYPESANRALISIGLESRPRNRTRKHDLY